MKENLMKKINMALILGSLLLVSSQAFAHPPSDIKIQLNLTAQTLNAVVEHHVSNPMAHYIKQVDIGLNGKKIKKLTFKKQEDNASQSIEIKIPKVKKGDILSVTAYCKLNGQLEKKVTVS